MYEILRQFRGKRFFTGHEKILGYSNTVEKPDIPRWCNLNFRRLRLRLHLLGLM